MLTKMKCHDCLVHQGEMIVFLPEVYNRSKFSLASRLLISSQWWTLKKILQNYLFMRMRCIILFSREWSHPVLTDLPSPFFDCAKQSCRPANVPGAWLHHHSQPCVVRWIQVPPWNRLTHLRLNSFAIIQKKKKTLFVFLLPINQRWGSAYTISVWMEEVWWELATICVTELKHPTLT